MVLLPWANAARSQNTARLSLTAEGAMYSMGEQPRLLDVARAADAVGLDFVDVTEHLLMGLNAVQAGHGWERHHLEQPQPEAEAVRILRQRFTEAGRDSASLAICDSLAPVDGSLERSMEQVPAMLDAGVTVVRVNLRRFMRSVDDVLPLVERAARLFEPYRVG